MGVEYTYPSRPYTITSTDHGGLIMIVTVLSMVYSIMIFAMRVYLRLAVNGPFGMDDYWIIAGTGIGVVQSAVMIHGVSHDHIGRSSWLLTHAENLQVAKNIYICEIFFLIGLAFSKVSLAMLLARLTRDRKQIIACNAIAALSLIWGIVCIFLVAINCDSDMPWNVYSSSCKGLYSRQKAICVYVVVTEAMLLIMPCVLVWNLQMSLKPKLIVVFAFAARSGCIACEIVRLHYIKLLFSTYDWAQSGAIAIILCQVEIHYGLMAATIPCLKPFMQALNTGYLGNSMRQQAYYTKYSGGQSYALNTMNTKASVQALRKQNIANKQFRPDQPEHTATVLAEASTNGRPESRESETSSGSDKMIIRKTENWTIQYDETPVQDQEQERDQDSGEGPSKQMTRTADSSTTQRSGDQIPRPQTERSF